MAQVMEKSGQRWTPRPLTSFKNERALQDVILGDPGLIPGCAGAAAADELPVPGVGSLDIALVDEVGTLTLVECKLRSNPQIRREVIGQILAYASGLRGQTSAEFADLWTRSRKREGEPARNLINDVSASVGATFDEDEFRAAIGDTLVSGSFRLVVAVDEITDELRSIIQFLSDHLDESVKVMALEVGLISEGSLKLLVVETYGQTFAPPETRSGPSKQRWSRGDVDTAVEQVVHKDERELVAALMKSADQAGARFSGGTGQAPSAGFYYQLLEKTPSLWSLYVRDSGPVVAFNIGSVANVSSDVGAKYLEEVNTGGLAKALGKAVASSKAYPEVTVRALVDNHVSALDIDDMFRGIRAVGQPSPSAGHDVGGATEAERDV